MCGLSQVVRLSWMNVCISAAWQPKWLCYIRQVLLVALLDIINILYIRSKPVLCIIFHGVFHWLLWNYWLAVADCHSQDNQGDQDDQDKDHLFPSSVWVIVWLSFFSHHLFHQQISLILLGHRQLGQIGLWRDRKTSWPLSSNHPNVDIKPCIQR